MNWQDAIETGAAILVSLGGGGAIVLGLSGWLGKVWANRLMENERQVHAIELEKLRDSLRRTAETELKALQAQLEIEREKIVREHLDRLVIYRAAIDLARSSRRS